MVKMNLSYACLSLQTLCDDYPFRDVQERSWQCTPSGTQQPTQVLAWWEVKVGFFSCLLFASDLAVIET